MRGRVRQGVRKRRDVTRATIKNTAQKHKCTEQFSPLLGSIKLRQGTEELVFRGTGLGGQFYTFNLSKGVVRDKIIAKRIRC